MPLFVLMTRLGSDVLQDPRGRKAVGRAWKKKVEKVCPGVRWLAHYALLGQYDFMDIYEAPDVETAHKVSYLSMAGGAANAESWHALPYEKYVDLIAASEKK